MCTAVPKAPTPPPPPPPAPEPEVSTPERKSLAANRARAAASSLTSQGLLSENGTIGGDSLGPR